MAEPAGGAGPERLAARQAEGAPPAKKAAVRRPAQIAVIGDFFIDIQAKVPRLPEWDKDVETPAVELLPGGSAANTARQLAALGPAVRFFSVCGDDALGAAALGKMEGQGFDTAHIKRLPRPSSVCMILSGPEDRAFVSCYSTVSAVALEHMDVAAVLQCSHLHIGGYLGACGLHTEALTELVRGCRERGATVSLGTNSAPTDQWLGQDQHLRRLLPYLDLVIVNERELSEITAALGQPPCALRPGLVVVETRGRDGTRIHSSACEPVDVATQAVKAGDFVDATGAGDAFAAGFLSRWLCRDGGSAADAAMWGNACAACVLRRSGACAEPVPAGEVREVYEALARQAGS